MDTLKNLIALLLLSFFLNGCGQVAVQKNDEIFSSKTILVDVRTPMEYHEDHLEKAVNIPLDKLKEDIKYFAPDKEQVIAVYCTSGRRTEIALKDLTGLGYKNVINAGKLKELKEIEEKRNIADPDE